MFGTQKGITPVIAIVLLLLVTVGAVGVVYTQFQSLVGDGPDAGFLDAESVDLGYRTFTRNSSASPNTVQANLVNDDDADYTFNESAEGSLVELQYSTDGEERVSPDLLADLSYNETAYNCDSLGTISPGEEPSCNTGVQMPSSGDSVTVHLVLASSDGEVTTYTCEPSTSTSNTC